jgi:hypothetical protein
MKNHGRPLATAAAAAAALFLLTTLAVSAASKQTLQGEYRWSGESGSLEAVFAPDGDGRWNVDFHFKFQGAPHVYSGTASGSLDDGDLEGTVRTENRRRTFNFRGAFEDGVFRGAHSEVQGGRESRTGTLTLRR